ncbi:MAG: diguanylate cyclase [Thiothrix sp.]|uniref:diguanylate cyclase domain-containing protein n=1 Tax=Thiothrix sp. TaxID=1032 RepID=UPI002629D399|nr:diguanylate cyclase [Thiothrix sp.]MDD5394214.1 diguanylate cyclase [Thiothrix sp.]
MLFIVPVLSLLGLAFALVWAAANGQLHFTIPGVGEQPLLTASMPYLLLAMLALQGTLLYVLARSTKRVGGDQSGVVDSVAPTGEQVNTEWVLDALAGGVVVVNPRGNITYMNASAEKLTLWQREKVMGEPVGNVLKLEDLQGTPIMGRAFEAHRAHPGHPLQFGQVKLYPRVGDPRFVELHTTCILEDCKAVVFIFRDVTADRKVINRLYRQASRDALTDLMNRASFEQYVEQLAHDTSSLLRTHVLASVDLDNFKIINDTCGHLAGDELLKQVAQIFRRSVRTSDKVARIGGDEFAVFLEGCCQDKGRSIMESILTELRNFRFSWEALYTTKTITN